MESAIDDRVVSITTKEYSRDDDFDVGNLDDNKFSWLGLKPGASQAEIEQYVRSVHVNAGHPSPAELAQTFKDAGCLIFCMIAECITFSVSRSCKFRVSFV